MSAAVVGLASLLSSGTVATSAGAAPITSVTTARTQAAAPSIEDPALGAVEPMPSQRVYDSRTSTPLRSGEARTITVTPTEYDGSWLGAWLNITATEARANGFLTLWSGDGARPTASTVNFGPGPAVPNLAAVRLSASGRVTIYNGSPGTVHIIVDRLSRVGNGTETKPGSTVPVTPFRALDTRQTKVKLAARSSVTVAVSGQGGIQSTASGVSLNVAAVNPTASGWATVHSPAVPRPTSSSLTWTQGTTRATAVMSQVSGGNVTVFNGSGAAVDLLVDVTGWIAPGSTEKRPTSVTLISPKRLADTRSGSPVKPGAIVVLPYAGVQPKYHWPIYSVTTTRGTGAGYLFFKGTSSSITNYGAATTTTSLTVFGDSGTTAVPQIQNSSGSSVDVIVDLVGWVGPDVWLSGHVRSPDGAPIVNASVGLARASSTPGTLQAIAGTTRTGSDGLWNVVATGSHVGRPVCATATRDLDPDAALLWGPACLGGTLTSPTSYVFATGTRGLGLDITLPRAGAIRGTMLRQGEPYIWPYLLARNVDTGWQSIRSGQPSDGVLTVDGLVDGRYLVLRYDTYEEYQFEWLGGLQAGSMPTEELLRRGATPVHVTAGSVTDIGTKEFELGGRITARFEGLGNHIGAVESEDGRLMFVRGLSQTSPLTQGGLRPGSYYICYQPSTPSLPCPGTAPRYGPVVVRAGETAEVTIPAS